MAAQKKDGSYKHTCLFKVNLITTMWKATKLDQAVAQENENEKQAN